MFERSSRVRMCNSTTTRRMKMAIIIVRYQVKHPGGLGKYTRPSISDVLDKTAQWPSWVTISSIDEASRL